MFINADWAGCADDQQFTSTYCTFEWENLVTWRSKKQNVMARSSAETQFRVMAQGVCEVIWLRSLLEELKVEYNSPMKLFYDNKFAIIAQVLFY